MTDEKREAAVMAAAIARMDAEQAKADQRWETLDGVREWLDGKHRDALQEEPYGQYVSRLPIELLAKLTIQEREQIDAFERLAFDRHRPLAQAREQQRRAFVAAGGTAAAFELNWETYGGDAHTARLADEHLERARQDDVF